ncbi:hypothetical protein GGS23DRAFT_596052 [Durotheca rogersii]|uniref:uncharacterized protein n=1 Tax=Durotheca rogersii TaxID=419775 RepID=UPI00221F673A|nr:uncharacterized protein GGS23DRAFT_596052 [Durotheca rogersii]KAI5864419.1 hypothetical protein GGS23DRAFT_596052 [Durotheca rogersii]
MVFPRGACPTATFDACRAFNYPAKGPGKKRRSITIFTRIAMVTRGLEMAITNAVTWGIKQGRASFQIVVLSLFEVAFVEVFVGDDEPFVKVSEPVNLSPLRAEYCMSTHPRERPELKPGMEIQRQRGELVMQSNCTGSADGLRDHFPGLASLVNFFEAAASRRATSQSSAILSRSSTPPKSPRAAAQRPSQPVILPPELHDRILDFVDDDTWRTCLVVSRKFRFSCLRKFRLDDRMSIVAGPFVEHHEEPRLSFNFEDTQTGKIFRTAEGPHFHRRTEEYNWMPVIGSDRKALMLNVVVQFEPAPAASMPGDE